MTKTLRVFGRKKYTKDSHKAFYTYSFTKDGKTFYKVKFNQGCRNIPTGTGYYLLEVEPSKLTIQHFAKHPEWNKVIWVADIVSCNADEKSNEELQKKALEEIDNLF